MLGDWKPEDYRYWPGMGYVSYPARLSRNGGGRLSSGGRSTRVNAVAKIEQNTELGNWTNAIWGKMADDINRKNRELEMIARSDNRAKLRAQKHKKAA